MTAKHDLHVDQLECHRDDITCLDINKERTKVITGSCGKWPSVHVWDAITGKKIFAFQLDKDSKAVMAVAISTDGKYVAAVDLSDKHQVFIYNLER